MRICRFLVAVAWYVLAVFVLSSLGVVSAWQEGPSAAAEERPTLELALPAPAAEQGRDEERDAVVTARFSSSGKYLAVGMQSGSLVVLDWTKGTLALVRSAHSQSLRLIDFAQNDQYLLTGANDLKVNFWDVVAQRPRLTFDGAPLRCLYDIRISPDAHYAASRGFDGFGVLWDLQKNEKMTDLFSYMFAFDPTGTFFVSGPRRQPGAQLIRLNQKAEPLQFAQDQSVSCFAIDPTGRSIAYAILPWNQPATVAVIDAQTCRALRRLSMPKGEKEGDVGITALCFSGDGKQLLLGCTDGCVQCVDAQTMQVRHVNRFASSVTVGHVEFTGPHRDCVMAWGWADGPEAEARCWKIGTTEPIWVKQGPATLDNKRMIGARVTSDGGLELFAARNGQTLRVLRGYARGTKWEY